MVARQGQGKASPTIGTFYMDRAASLQTQYFPKLYPSSFTASYPNKVPQDFIDQIQWDLDVMRVSYNETVEQEAH